MQICARPGIAQVIDEEINLSVINKIELPGFSKGEQDLIDFVACSNIYPMNDAIVGKTIEVRSFLNQTAHCCDCRNGIAKRVGPCFAQHQRF